MEDFLKTLSPDHPALFNNCEYHTWFEGKYLGIAIWKDGIDEPGSFQNMELTDQGVVPVKIIVDQWHLKMVQCKGD